MRDFVPRFEVGYGTPSGFVSGASTLAGVSPFAPGSSVGDRPVSCSGFAVSDEQARRKRTGTARIRAIFIRTPRYGAGPGGAAGYPCFVRGQEGSFGSFAPNPRLRQIVPAPDCQPVPVLTPS